MSGRKIQRTADWAFWESAEVAALDLAEFKTLYVCAMKADQADHAMKAGAAKSTVFRLRRKDVSEKIHPRRWGDGPESILSSLASKGFVRVVGSKRRVGYYIEWMDNKAINAPQEPKRDEVDIPYGSPTSQNGGSSDQVDLPQGSLLTFHREAPLRSGKDQERNTATCVPQGSSTEKPASQVQNGNGAHTTPMAKELTEQERIEAATEFWENGFGEYTPECDPLGESFWLRYPAHSGRREKSTYKPALAAWRMLMLEDIDTSKPMQTPLNLKMKEIFEGLIRWTESDKWAEDDGHWIPNIDKFIREKKFLDNPPPVLSKPY